VDKFDITFPINREADQVGIGTAKVDGVTGPLAEVDDLQRPATRFQNGRDQLKPQGWEEPRMEPVTEVGIDAEGMVIRQHLPIPLIPEMFSIQRLKLNMLLLFNWNRQSMSNFYPF
jgi:hypothetical protein